MSVIHGTICIVDPSSSLRQYIQEQTQVGLSYQQIVNQLLLAGWTLQTLQTYAPELFMQSSAGAPPQQFASIVPAEPLPQTVFTPQQITPTLNTQDVQSMNSQNMIPAQSISRFKIKYLIILVLVLVLMIGGAAGYYLISKKSGSSLSQLNDPNFSMSIPKDWKRDAGYQPGSTVVLYYSPEDSDVSTRDKAAQFTAYIGLKFDRIDQQIQYLAESKAEHTILRDEKYEEGNISYRLVELTAKINGQNNMTHILSINASRGDFLINADVVSLDENWQLHAEEAEAMLKSIKPGCDNTSEKNEVSSDVTLLCS